MPALRSRVAAAAVLSQALSLVLAGQDATCKQPEPPKPVPSSSMLQVNTKRSPKAALSPLGRFRFLTSASFSQGTYRITHAGTYTLTEDITFDPHYPGSSWSQMPPDSSSYPLLEGYYLGFFAAVTVEATNVVIDCQGHEIKMSRSFHKKQRFFSIFELASSPFPKDQGPPQFSSNVTFTGSPVSAHNVTIRNCRIGLSSHHSIHGNDNTGVTLRNLQMYDFEVAGVALNGASHVEMDSLNIGPSLPRTFKAALSQALFLDHMANTLMRQDFIMSAGQTRCWVKLRGHSRSVYSIFRQLRSDLHSYFSGRGLPSLPRGALRLARLFGAGRDLPDGSAIYGLMLHRSGVAINQLGFCPDDATNASKRVKHIRLNGIQIHDLAVKVEQVTNLNIHGERVMGPAGDVFQITKGWNPSSCYEYVGNSFLDAQLAMGAYKSFMQRRGTSSSRIQFFFGGSHIPQEVLDWAAGTWSCSTSETWAKQIVARSSSVGELTCTGDAMNHFNKGAIGMRLGFQEDVHVEGVVIENVENQGVPDAAAHCNITGEAYMGVDVRGVSLARMMDLHKFDVEQLGTFSSTNSSRVFPVTGFLEMRADDVKVLGS
mmetsp:Transcript_90298/g.264157  ORF Transcript_90298/g.264157 Transcript_90298/m.264157 type:complete len:599 (+) Transcript_90298:79-1875(+)